MTSSGNGHKVPKHIRVPVHLLAYWNAFQNLCSHRQSGAHSAQPITVEAVAIYAKSYCLNIRKLLDVVSVLDTVLLNKAAASREKEETGKKPVGKR